ncbi:MAG: hypothetical protein ACRDA2_02260 [Cetobacterium sp.]|uniref:hypothetical protein n=1 Tax=Cetobacterium sp. TaxID=2071632 RepID=UPI003EE5BFCA
MKIDRIIQSCLNIHEIPLTTRIFTKDYIMVPEENGTITLKSNSGKTVGRGNNIGVAIGDFEMYNKSLIEGLGLQLIRNNLLEFCIDVEFDYKMIDHKNIAISFHNALTEFGCKRITNTFKTEKGVSRKNQALIGVKGYKNNNYGIKLYSKNEELVLKAYDTDIIRFELVVDNRAIDKMKLVKTVNEELVIDFVNEFFSVWKQTLKRKNRYTIPTFDLIQKLIETM